jgi:hypothetical protein
MYLYNTDSNVFFKEDKKTLIVKNNKNTEYVEDIFQKQYSKVLLETIFDKDIN